MNYKLHYDKIIKRAKNRQLDCYTESHHIIPRCMNGKDDKDNLANLTAREHFIAHILLVKIYPNEKGLINAVNMMTVDNNSTKRIHNRMYGWLKEKFIERQSERQKGEKNSQYGTIWVYKNNETIKIKKAELKQFEYEGWQRGRKEKAVIKKEKKISKLKIERSKLIKESDIDFSKHGWVGKAGELFNIGENKAGRWIKKNLPEFYENKCYKRRSCK